MPAQLIALIQALAQNGNTGGLIDILRALAQVGLVEEIGEAIARYGAAVQVNGAAVRNFLGATVPGLLANNYFNQPQFGQGFYMDWIEYTTAKDPSWADPIRQAAQQGNGQALGQATAQLHQAVVAWVGAGKP